MSDHGFVTRRQLRMLACVEAVLREVLGIVLLPTAERRADGTFRFGEDDLEPAAPWVELRHHDLVRGDAWSGDSADWDVFALRGARHEDGLPVHLEFHSQDHSLAGRCEEVFSSYPPDVLQVLTDAFHRLRTTGLPPSPDLAWMLSPQERLGQE